MFPHFSPHFYILYLIFIFCTSFLYLVPHFYDNLVSKAIQKYLYKGCNFYPVLSCVQKLKFHHAPKDIGCWKFAYLKCLFKFSDEKFVELFQFFIIKPPSALLLLIRVLNIQSGNHFVWRKFEYKTCRINIFWSVMENAKGLIEIQYFISVSEIWILRDCLEMGLFLSATIWICKKCYDKYWGKTENLTLRSKLQLIFYLSW